MSFRHPKKSAHGSYPHFFSQVSRHAFFPFIAGFGINFCLCLRPKEGTEKRAELGPEEHRLRTGPLLLFGRNKRVYRKKREPWPALMGGKRKGITLRMHKWPPPIRNDGKKTNDWVVGDNGREARLHLAEGGGEGPFCPPAHLIS